MLRHLVEKHSVTLVSFIRPDDQKESILHLQDVCRAVYTVPMHRSLYLNARAILRGLIGRMPIVLARDEMKQMTETLNRVISENTFDVVHADQLSMAGYGKLASSAGIHHSVLDQHNALYLLARQMAAKETSWVRKQIISREAGTLARYEADMCRFYDAVLTVTDEDRDRLILLQPPEERIAMAKKLTPIPICIEPCEKTPPRFDWKRRRSEATILHIGTMFWPPNVEGVLWFAREILPEIHKQIPHARFLVVGKSPPAAVRALTVDSRVEVTGYLSDPVSQVASADVFVVPLLTGEGMRVKILDAWSWGIPIVSTSIGAEGILAKERENILLADNAVDFASAVLSALEDRSLNQRLRTCGRAWVEEHYNWRTKYRLVDQVYDQLLA